MKIKSRMYQEVQNLSGTLENQKGTKFTLN